jgi:Transcription factor WhiB
MILRTNQPDFSGGGNPAKAGHCLRTKVTRDYDPWFGVGDSMDEAVKICNGTYSGIVCPQRNDCLIWSLINNEAHGIYGGMYEDDRTQLRRFTPREEWEWQPPTHHDPSDPVDPDALFKQTE